MFKWYVLYTASGSEKKIKLMIEDQIKKKNMSEYFEDIVVPVIEVPEIKRGKKVLSEKKFMPGYVLLKMNMTDESWHLVKSVPKIAGFLGGKNTPSSLNQAEVDTIFKQIESETDIATKAGLYSPGDSIKINDGPFESFSGLVESVNFESQKLKVSVSIFGKETPIELDFTQVRKSE
jgi:transcriptional antiterminator NusG